MENYFDSLPPGEEGDKVLKLAATREKAAKSTGKSKTAKGSGKHLPPEGRYEPVITCLDDIEAEEVAWLWPGYIALRKICLVEGDPSHGKTWVTLAIAAAISQGWPLPDQDTGINQQTELEPASVIYMTAEDGLSDTIKPRMINLGADCDKIYVIEGQRQGDKEMEPVTMQDLDILRQAMEQVKPALLIIDPLQGFLGAGVDMHRANETRPVLTGILRLAEEFNCAVVIIRHLNKSSGGKAAYRGMGSIDFTATARTVLLVGKDPDDPHKRIVIPTKCNVGAEGVPVAFTLTPEEGFRWAGKADRTAEDLLYPQAKEDDGNEKGKVDEAQDFLEDILQDGPVSSNEIFSKAGKAGISKASIRRAKELLNIQAYREPGKGREAAWMWRIRSSNISNEHLEQVIETPKNTGLEIDAQDAQSKLFEQVKKPSWSDVGRPIDLDARERGRS
ncbi:MAG: AAA family ATPase [Syntrophomonadaceae bacterium]